MRSSPGAAHESGGRPILDRDGWVMPLAGLWPMLVIALALALALRLAFIAATPHFTPNNDPADYDHIARSLANGHGYPPTLLAAPGTASALRPPGYPLLLALVYALGGHWLAGRVANALIGVAVVLVIYLIARAIWDDRRAVVAAGLAAVFPPFIALNGSLLSEPLFVLLELLVVLAVLRYQDRERRLAYAGLIGLLCAGAALTRSVGLLLPVAAIVGIWTAPDSTRRQAGASTAVLVVVMCMAIAPWAIRNSAKFHGAFVPVSTQDGITAAGTYNTEAAAPGRLYAVWRPPFAVASFKSLFTDSLNEAELDTTLRNDALSYAMKHPGYLLATIGLNSLRLLNVGPGSGPLSQEWYYEMGVPRSARRWVSIGGDVLIAVAVLAPIAAMILTSPAVARRRPRRRHWFVWLVPVLMYVGVVPINGAFRYRSPIDPFFILLAAYTVVFAADIAGRSSRQRAATSAAAGP